MISVDVSASLKYKVLIENGILENCGKLVSDVISPCRAAIISDDKVYPLYGEKVKKSLENSGFKTCFFTFKNGEQSKNIKTYSQILEFLAQEKISRTDIIIALGGGVVGDVAGFCAATYLRGISFVQIPTTILSAVDSSVGGKTAIDLEHGKNLAGAFHQPSVVICDTDTFKTLDKKQISCGYAEIIKYGVICDKDLFTYLSSNDTKIEDIVKRCVEIKRDIVESDEKDFGIRKLLNFGHTLGHAIEKHSNFALTHGEAVSVGMMMISKLSENLKLNSENITNPLMQLIEKYSLPTSYKISKSDMLSLCATDKKTEGSMITLVIPEKIGKCVLKKVSFEQFEKMLDAIYK